MEGKRLLQSVSIGLGLLAMYGLSEGPARWMAINNGWADDGIVYATLAKAYQPVEIVFEDAPAPVRDARETYLEWFAPFWFKASFLHLD